MSDYAYETLLVDIDAEGIALVTINRTEVLNALNDQCWDDLADLVHAVAHDEAVRCVIITGSGAKAFAAGADISELASKTVAQLISYKGQSVLNAIENNPKPFIAAVNGYALGGGCELAAACDIRIASDNAVFGLPETGLGILPGVGGTQRISRLIGLGRAKELILMGERYDAQKALQVGLVTKVTSSEDLISEAFVLAQRIIAKSPLSIQVAKRVVQASLSSSEDVGMLTECLAMAALSGCDDKSEGMTAFLEKRSPRFTGK